MNSTKINFYLFLLAVFGGLVFAMSCFFSPEFPNYLYEIEWLPLLLFFVLNIVAEKNFVVLPYGNSASASFAIILAALLLFEPHLVTVMAIISILFTGGFMQTHGWKLSLFQALQYLVIYSLAGISMELFFYYMPELFDDKLYRFLLIGGMVTFIYLFLNIAFTNAYIALLNPHEFGKYPSVKDILNFRHDKLKIYQILFLFPLAVIIAYSYDIVENPFVPVILAIMCIGSVRFVEQHIRIGRQSRKMAVLYQLFQHMSKVIFQNEESVLPPEEFFKNILSNKDISTHNLIPNHRTAIFEVRENSIDGSKAFKLLTAYPEGSDSGNDKFTENDALLTKVAEANQLLRLNNIRRYKDVNDDWKKNYRSIIASPITLDSEVSYILIMFRHSGEAFGQLDRHFMNLLVNSISFTLKNMQLRDKLQQQAEKDGLLGIFNRRYLIGKLEEELQRVKRYERPLSIIIIDVDYFKGFNDTHGHILGDKVLRDITQIIENSIRHTDIPARYGGDELIIVLPETKLDGAVTAANKIHARVGEHSFQGKEGESVNMSLSIGVTEAKIANRDEDIESAEAIIARADQALYESKTKGRNQINYIKSEK